MTRKFIALISAVVLLGISNVLAQSSASDEIIRVNTTLVSVPVIVSDRQGRYVPNLKAEDFTIYQDGVKQNIEFFAATDEPLNVALLIDTSHSTRDVLDDIKDAALDFIKLLQPQDKVSVVSFDYEPHVLIPLTSDRSRLKNAIKDAEIGEYAGTTLRDAVFDVVNQSFANVKGRKAIILLTDGKDAGSQTPDSDLFYSLQESDSMIYTVFYQTGRRFNQDRFDFPRRRGGMRRGGIFRKQFPPFPREGGSGDVSQRRERVMRKNEEAQEFLQKLSNETAGRFYQSEVTNLRKTFGLIVEELRYQYRLGFYPVDEKTDGTVRALKVKIARPDTVVRARGSYRPQNKLTAN